MVPGLMIRAGLLGSLYTALAAPLLLAIMERFFGFRMEFGAVSKRGR